MENNFRPGSATLIFSVNNKLDYFLTLLLQNKHLGDVTLKSNTKFNNSLKKSPENIVVEQKWQQRLKIEIRNTGVIITREDVD